MVPAKDRGRVVFCAALVALFVNPWVEAGEASSPTLFMFSHYALFGAGMLLGTALGRGRPGLWVFGVFFALLWHTPQGFALSAALPPFRAAEEASMFLGGLLTGSSLRFMGEKTRLVLLALWVVGDTLLSVIFIGRPQLYSQAAHSPYVSSGFPVTGVAMVFLMNALLAYLLYRYVENINRRLVGRGEKRVADPKNA